MSEDWSFDRQAVRPESRYTRQFGSNSLIFTAFKTVYSSRGKSLARTLSLRRTPTTVADHGYTADSGSILIARCPQIIAGLARSIECNRTVWHNETRQVLYPFDAIFECCENCDSVVNLAGMFLSRHHPSFRIVREEYAC